MLDADSEKVLFDLKVISDRLQVSMLLIGARARLLTFDSRYKVQGRATTDTDVAIELDDWASYTQFTDEMTQSETAPFRKTNVIHRFIHLESQIEVDLIPFGKIGFPDKIITWNDGNQMSILGLQEAFLSASIQRVGNQGILAVEPASFVGLKLLAWGDRRSNKDLDDVYFVLQHYQEPDRVFEELANELINSRIDFEDASILLLGLDMQAIFYRETLVRIDKILIELLEKQNRYFSRFAPRNWVGDQWDTAFATIVKRFEILQQGISERN